MKSKVLKLLVKKSYAIKVRKKKNHKDHSIKNYYVSVLQSFTFSFWRMDATQMINDSLLESDEEENDANQTSRGIPVAKLHVLKNEHVPETGEWMKVRGIVPEHHLRVCYLMCNVVFLSLRIATLFGRKCFGPGW